MAVWERDGGFMYRTAEFLLLHHLILGGGTVSLKCVLCRAKRNRGAQRDSIFAQRC